MNWGVLVINMTANQQRWQSISGQLDALGLPYQRVEAVVGKELSETELANIYQSKANRAKYHKALNAGEIGCYMSHIACWERMLELGWDWALILEDDALLQNNLLSCIDALPKIQAPWDCIKLSCGSRQKSVLQRTHLATDCQLTQARKLNATTTGQFVSRQGAQKLLAHALPIARPVDTDMQYWFEKDLIVFGFEPLPVTSAGFDSEINQVKNRKKTPNRVLPRLVQRLYYEWGIRRAPLSPMPDA
ncbi:glycosyltransferase family 25 protein [Paraferrimonas sedimenticola]|uniref:glycosyltransferase family 25 protein n=1 Tax=Paraferrimonas sedimenticola TaxID=375674 RepID=UPI001476335F|nr:glycosyltransferase family 25 protein [Paraferrimonas sedimenticola]